MKTELILVGKTTNKHFVACINDYVERIGHYMPFSITTIPELKNAKSLSEDQQKEREGKLIMKQLQASDTDRFLPADMRRRSSTVSPLNLTGC